ncbi:MAG: hypothetical protein JST89_11340 [Cyanobacteria bacterium SZAS-4]|nr:hypothetical protein [Cyanobacteria bacterium SZAS-4]
MNLAYLKYYVRDEKSKWRAGAVCVCATAAVSLLSGNAYLCSKALAHVAQNEVSIDPKQPHQFDLDQEIRIRDRAAQLALKEDDPVFTKIYLDLATLQARHGLIAKSVQSARQAISKMSPNDDQPLFYDDDLISALIENSHFNEAELLLREACAKSKNLENSGFKGAHYNTQLMLLFYFYVVRGQRAKALTVLDQLVPTGFQTEPRPSYRRSNSYRDDYGIAGNVPNYLRNLVAGVASGSSFATSFRPKELARTLALESDFKKTRCNNEQLQFCAAVLNKMLALQEQIFEAYDERLAATFIALAEVKALSGNEIEACKNYKESLEIVLRKTSDTSTFVPIENKYLSLLRRIGDPVAVRRAEHLIRELDAVASSETKDSTKIYNDKCTKIDEEIKQKNFEQSEKSINELEKFLSTEKDSASARKRLLIQYSKSADLYLEHGARNLAVKYALKSFGAPNDSTEFLRSYDQPTLFALVTDFCKSGNYIEAINLLNSVLTRMSEVPTLQPLQKIDAQNRLAEVLFQQSQHETDPALIAKLKSESESNFQLAMALSSKANLKPALINQQMARRRILLTKPAIYSLNLDGPIEYTEPGHGGSVGGLELEGKYVLNLKAHRDMDISDGDDGEIVLLDKKTFEDLANEYLDEGDLEQARNCLIAGMRCRLSSRNFELLGEYWYLNGDSDGALQACDMALELEPNNYPAVCLKELIQSRASSSPAENSAVTSTSIAPPSVTTQPTKLAKVFALMASHKYSDAISLLTPMIEASPQRWRELFLREQCYRALNDAKHAAEDNETAKMLEYKAAQKRT